MTTLGGRYELGDVIGRGGMAQVYRGTDTVLGRTVAIKILSPQFAQDPDFVARFRREAQAAAKLNHPNVVGVYDSGSDDGTHYIVMEYVQGRTLAEILKQDGRLLPERAIEIAESVCEALSFAHAEGIVHRDIKSGNIMITAQGEVKVMDFGIAGAATQETVAQTAAVIGTASYLSPEQARGEPVDARTDIYSLGVVLFEMLAGRTPFSGDTPVAVAFQHVQETPPRPSEFAPGIPSDLEAVVMRTLAKNPANRYGSTDELRADLKRVRLGQRVAATPIMPATETQVLRPTEVMPRGEEPPGGSGKWALGILITLIVLAILGIGTYLLVNGGFGPGPSPSASPGAQVDVPNIVGLTEDAARTQLEQAGLELGVVTRKESTETPGTVVKTDPEVGSSVKQGTSVDIWLAEAASPAPQLVVVPDVVGRTQAKAEREIADAGLQVGSETLRSSSTVKEGRVISQNPAAGSQVETNTTVSLVISSGPETVEVPDVVCLTIPNATNQLSNAGLDPNVVPLPPSPNPSCPHANRVGAQDPAAGTEVEAGSSVTLHPAA